MKKIVIEVVLDKGSQVMTRIKTQGYSEEVISDQFELVGILDNVKSIIQERIKKQLDIKK